MTKAIAPIDLLRELRKGFDAEAKHFRSMESVSFSNLEMRAHSSKAYAAEQAVRKIDATLRDWA